MIPQRKVKKVNLLEANSRVYNKDDRYNKSLRLFEASEGPGPMNSDRGFHVQDLFCKVIPKLPFYLLYDGEIVVSGTTFLLGKKIRKVTNCPW